MANEFKIFVGPMFSGKSTHLINEIDKAKYQKKSWIVFKPKIDNRSGKNKILSHNGVSLPATEISDANEINNYVYDENGCKEFNKIFCDELFMIPNAYKVIVSLYVDGFDICASSLDLSAKAKPYNDIVFLMAYATEIIKCHAYCSVCGEKAFFTNKKTNTDVEFEIGAEELYEPMCLQHYMRAYSGNHIPKNE